MPALRDCHPEENNDSSQSQSMCLACMNMFSSHNDLGARYGDHPYTVMRKARHSVVK